MLYSAKRCFVPALIIIVDFNFSLIVKTISITISAKRNDYIHNLPYDLCIVKVTNMFFFTNFRKNVPYKMTLDSCCDHPETTHNSERKSVSVLKALKVLKQVFSCCEASSNAACVIKYLCVQSLIIFKQMDTSEFTC